MPFKFNRLTLLANIFSLQFTEISEYKPSSSYRTPKSRFFPYIHCKFCRACPTTKMKSATVKPCIDYGLHVQGVRGFLTAHISWKQSKDYKYFTFEIHLVPFLIIHPCTVYHFQGNCFEKNMFC